MAANPLKHGSFIKYLLNAFYVFSLVLDSGANDQAVWMQSLEHCPSLLLLSDVCIQSEGTLWSVSLRD